jgi:hypothetical protein
MSDTAPVFPEAVTGTGPTAQLKVGDPLPGTPKKQPTKEQSEAFGFGSSALAANNVITRLETRGIYGRMGSVAQTLEWLSKVDPAPAVAAGSGAGAVIGIMVPVIGGPGGGSVVGGAFGAGIMGLTMLLAEPLANMARTPEEQQYFQAKSDFIGAVLRKESGAAISNSEYRREEQRFFPQLDDKPPVIKQKAEARARKIREFEVQSGRKLMP